MLEKQNRIRQAQLCQIRLETAEEIAKNEKSKRNTETLLHQEQISHKTLREEFNIEKEQFVGQLKELDRKHKNDRVCLVEFSDKEMKMMSQIAAFKTVCEERAQKIGKGIIYELIVDTCKIFGLP